MPYFGKTDYTMADRYGPDSIVVYDYQSYHKDPILIALEIGELYISVANGELFEVWGKVAFLQYVERLPATTLFAKSEEVVKQALVEWMVEQSMIDEEE